MASEFRQRRLAYAKRMVDAIEEQLVTGVGVVNVNVDGMSVTMNREKAFEELQKWSKLVIRLSRTKSRTSAIRLDTA